MSHSEKARPHLSVAHQKLQASIAREDLSLQSKKKPSTPKLVSASTKEEVQPSFQPVSTKSTAPEAVSLLPRHRIRIGRGTEIDDEERASHRFRKDRGEQSKAPQSQTPHEPQLQFNLNNGSSDLKDPRGSATPSKARRRTAPGGNNNSVAMDQKKKPQNLAKPNEYMSSSTIAPSNGAVESSRNQNCATKPTVVASTDPKHPLPSSTAHHSPPPLSTTREETIAKKLPPERLACDEIDRLISLPVEHCIASGVAVLGSEEKKHEDSDTVSLELARNLFFLLSDLDEEVTDAETHRFVSLLQQVLPMMVVSHNLTAKTTSDIMSRAVDTGIAIPIVERLIQESEQLVGHATWDCRELYQQNPVYLVSDLITTLNSMEQCLDSPVPPKAEDKAENLDAFSESYAISDDAIEVHVDITGLEEELGDDKEEEEPWWKVASKLHGYTIRPPVPELTPQQLLQKVNDNKVNQDPIESTVDDHINKFWDQQHKQPKRSVRPKQGQVKLPDRRKQNDRRKHTTTKENNKATTADQGISAVASVSSLAQRRSRRKRISNQLSAIPWFDPYSKRTENHAGFSKVDKYSLYKSTQVQTNAHCLDRIPWEERLVKQRFLYEQNLTGRNWFGALRIKAGNVVCPQPVCRPSSMEMPMDAESWTEDWVKPPRSAMLEALGPEYEIYMGDDDDDSDCSWEDTPECGKLKNVIVRPGEIVSRLSPDYTSSLRRSRWRKKYVRRSC